MKNRPTTAARCSARLASAGSASMRAASTPRSVLGMAQRSTSPVATHRSPSRRSTPCSTEPADDLLEEERIPPGALDDLRPKRLLQVGDAKQALGQLLAGLRHEGGGAYLGEPVGIVALGVEPERPSLAGGLRPAGDHQHQGQPIGQLHHDGEQLHGGRVRPVDVLHSDDDRAALGQPLEHRAYGDDDAGLQRARVEGAGTGRAEVDAEQMRQRRLVLLGLLAGQAAQRRAQLRPGDRLGIGGADSERAAEHLDQGRVARALGERLAPPLEPTHAVGQCLADLDLEPGLADARLAHDRHHLPAPLAQVVDARAQGTHLRVAPDDGRGEAGDPAGPAARGAHPRHAIGGDGSGEALQRELSHGLGLEQRVEDPVGLLAHHHPGAVACGLQASGEVGHLAGHHELVGGARGRDGLARGHADAQVEPHPVVRLEERVELLQALPHGQRGAHRALGVVLVDPWHAENGHDGVASVLLDGAAKDLDLLAHLVEEGRQHGAQLLGVVPGGELGRPDEIGEQHGDGLALVGGGSHA